MGEQVDKNEPYKLIVVKDNDKIKEAHAIKGEKVFLRAIHDKTTTIVSIKNDGGSFTLSLEEILQLPKDLKETFKISDEDLAKT
jgi:hypothetical protein